MYISKRALSILYWSLDRKGQKELIELEKEIDRYVTAVERKEIDGEVSVLLKAENLPDGIKERLLNLSKRTAKTPCFPFVLTAKDDLKKNRRFPKEVTRA